MHQDYPSPRKEQNTCMDRNNLEQNQRMGLGQEMEGTKP